MPFRKRLKPYVGLAAASLLLWAAWDPHPESEVRFDRQRNGLWVGHRFWSGRNVRTGASVPLEDVDSLVARARRYGVTQLYVHAGPIRPDGTVRDLPAPIFHRLKAALPGARVLPWLGCWIGRDTLLDEEWRARLIKTLVEMQARGVDGVHLDLEPLTDEHPGYVTLLEAIRDALGPRFFISQASRRAGPHGVSVGPLRDFFWSADFYRKTMERTDQTVLMGYDTTMRLSKHYVAFMAHQTKLLSALACSVPNHELLIGIPTYEDNPATSDPSVENVPNAARGVRAGLEAAGADQARCVLGVALYADWVTADEEWQQLETHWIRRVRR